MESILCVIYDGVVEERSHSVTDGGRKSCVRGGESEVSGTVDVTVRSLEGTASTSGIARGRRECSIGEQPSQGKRHRVLEEAGEGKATEARQRAAAAREDSEQGGRAVCHVTKVPRQLAACKSRSAPDRRRPRDVAPGVVHEAGSQLLLPIIYNSHSIILASSN